MPNRLGVSVMMLLIVGLMLGQLFQTSAILREGLRWGGAALLLWMAWKIARTGGLSVGTAGARPMRFLEAAAFQWINPKAWTMAVAATSQFIRPDAPFATAALVAGSFLVLGLGSSSTWTYAGQAIARWLTTDRRLRIFNMVMAALIVLSVVQILLH